MINREEYIGILETNNAELKKENQELKKQLKEKKNPFKGIFAQVNDDTLLRDCGNMNAEINELKNQQKEFIEYLENEIKHFEEHIVFSTNYFKGHPDYKIVIEKDDLLIRKYKEILSKYKEINHIPDNGKTVGDDK